MSIRLENVSHTYGKGTPFEQTALEPLSLEIKDYRPYRFGKINVGSTVERPPATD